MKCYDPGERAALDVWNFAYCCCTATPTSGRFLTSPEIFRASLSVVFSRAHAHREYPLLTRFLHDAVVSACCNGRGNLLRGGRWIITSAWQRILWSHALVNLPLLRQGENGSHYPEDHEHNHLVQNVTFALTCKTHPLCSILEYISAQNEVLLHTNNDGQVEILLQPRAGSTFGRAYIVMAYLHSSLGNQVGYFMHCFEAYP